MTSCSFDEFKCKDASKCIPKEERCDMNEQCQDASDETDCVHYNRTTSCKILQFQCTEGLCIDMNALCDSFRDCAGGEDELNCGAFADNCKIKGLLRCTNGQCYDRDWRCDGAEDCTDGSDEYNCRKPMYFLLISFFNTRFDFSIK